MESIEAIAMNFMHVNGLGRIPVDRFPLVLLAGMKSSQNGHPWPSA